MNADILTHDVIMDDIRHCIILRSLDEPFIKETVTPKTVIKCIRTVTNMPWKQLADYVGIQSSSILFKSYIGKYRNLETLKVIANLLFITPDNTEVHLYRAGYQPANGTYPPYTPPAIHCNEPDDVVVYTKIPTRIFTRTSVSDPLDRLLTMTISPSNGYIIDESSDRINTTGSIYTAHGKSASLTRVLQHLHYVGTVVSPSDIHVAISDNSGAKEGVVSHTVRVSNVPTKVISIPELHISDIESSTVGEFIHTEDLITVTDDDNKILGVRITPFDCELYGFTTTSTVYKQGTIFNVSGTPSHINTIIKNIRILPLEQLAYIGVELRSIDPTGADAPIKINKYVTIGEYVEPPVEEEVAPEDDVLPLVPPVDPEGETDLEEEVTPEGEISPPASPAEEEDHTSPVDDELEPEIMPEEPEEDPTSRTTTIVR